ncbi:MAG: M23 family metallopeptidase [Actinomycetota bacterium]|nr:M23 family metallopeptidase [Actinomycetota bacterium]
MTQKERTLDPPVAPRLEGFLSDHTSTETVVHISVEPEVIYAEAGRYGVHLNFDFSLTGLTTRVLDLVFLKVAAYDQQDRLLTYRYVNRNAVGPAGIETLVATRIEGTQPLHLFNPFHTFPVDLAMDHLRYMFTFRDIETNQEFYYGNVVVTPTTYNQAVQLALPVRGTVTVIDGHDYFSHHRRFDMNIARAYTQGAMQTNFARYALDFVHIGEDGNTRRMPDEEREANYDLRFPDARRFYSDGAPVFSPADGEVAVAVDGKPDHYESPFDFDAAVAGSRVHDLAGNYVVIRHNDREYSHLFHFLAGSINVEAGELVKAGDLLGRIGFSGAATVYSHLHYQLMDGPDYLTAECLPARFGRVTLLRGSRRQTVSNATIDTGDIIRSE